MNAPSTAMETPDVRNCLTRVWRHSSLLTSTRFDRKPRTILLRNFAASSTPPRRAAPEALRATPSSQALAEEGRPPSERPHHFSIARTRDRVG